MHNKVWSFLSIFFVLTISTMVWAQNDQEVPAPDVDKGTEVKFDSVPDSVEQFLALRQSQFSEGTKLSAFEGASRGAALFVLACYIYTNVNEKLGLQCLMLSSHPSHSVNSYEPYAYEGKALSNWNVQAFQTRIRSKAYIARSYFAGATPENNYEVKLPLVVQFTNNRYSVLRVNKEGKTIRYKVFVHCSGAASARPVSLAADEKGMWLAEEYSSLTVGVRYPKEK